jgi:hypothetical protein
MSEEWVLTRGFRMLGLSYGLACSSDTSLGDDRYFSPGEIYSQWTNWDNLEPIPYQQDMDSYAHFYDESSAPLTIDRTASSLEIRGDLSSLEANIQDRRWSLLGNQGLWFRFALAIQEQHRLYAFHAASIYHPEDQHLVVLIGKAGAGKSVFLLSAIAAGWQVFSTEMTYFSPEGTFLRGSLMDNVYFGTLAQDFPEISHQLGLDLPEIDDPWSQKLSVDLRQFAPETRELPAPQVSILFPHVEKGLDCAVIKEIDDPRILRRRLYESASEKISGAYLLHERIPGPPMDTPELASARLQAVDQLIAPKTSQIRSARVVSTGPNHCMEGLLP